MSVLSCHLSGVHKPAGAFFFGFIFLSFKMQILSVSCFSYSWYLTHAHHLRLMGTTEFSRNTMWISTACRLISNFP
jgi:hypothetical protein